MATVQIPPLMLDLTKGEREVTVPGGNLGQVINEVELAYPGFKARILDDGKLREELMATVDGRLAQFGLRQKVSPDSVVVFVPAVAGG